MSHTRTNHRRPRPDATHTVRDMKGFATQTNYGQVLWEFLSYGRVSARDDGSSARDKENNEKLLVIRKIMRRVTGVSGVSAPMRKVTRSLFVIRKIMRRVTGVSGVSAPNKESYEESYGSFP